MCLLWFANATHALSCWDLEHLSPEQQACQWCSWIVIDWVGEVECLLGWSWRKCGLCRVVCCRSCSFCRVIGWTWCETFRSYQIVSLVYFILLYNTKRVKISSIYQMKWLSSLVPSPNLSIILEYGQYPLWLFLLWRAKDGQVLAAFYFSMRSRLGFFIMV